MNRKRRSRKFARKSIEAVNEGGNKGEEGRKDDVSAVDTHANSSLSLRRFCGITILLLPSPTYT